MGETHILTKQSSRAQFRLYQSDLWFVVISRPPPLSSSYCTTTSLFLANPELTGSCSLDLRLPYWEGKTDTSGLFCFHVALSIVGLAINFIYAGTAVYFVTQPPSVWPHGSAAAATSCPLLEVLNHVYRTSRPGNDAHFVCCRADGINAAVYEAAGMEAMTPTG